LVLPLNEAGDGTVKESKCKGFRNKTAWTPRYWTKVSEDTGIGNPKKATAEKGKRYLEDLTTKISEFFIEFAECDLEDLYE
jgi:creatinine amidohydrolase